MVLSCTIYLSWASAVIGGTLLNLIINYVFLFSSKSVTRCEQPLPCLQSTLISEPDFSGYYMQISDTLHVSSDHFINDRSSHETIEIPLVPLSKAKNDPVRR